LTRARAAPMSSGMLNGRHAENERLKLNIIFFKTEPPQGDTAIRTPVTDVPGEFADLGMAVATAKASAADYPLATWIVIEDEGSKEYARLAKTNGKWERVDADRP
jgi:hypothetical protein